MKKSFTFLMLFLMVGMSAIAKPVSEEMTSQVANAFMAHKLGKSSCQLDLLTKSQSNAWYIYKGDMSWVIVSGDTDLYPVLGFSTNSDLSESTMPPAMKSYLDAREDQVELIRARRISHPENQNAWKAFEKSQFYASRSEIEPLLETRWNQGWPYNMMCPAHSEGPGGHVYAGCVATAMSQIMKFHNYPETGRFIGTYYWGADIEVDFSEGNYQWDEMTETATSLSREAIAKLMFHCGVSVNMDYAYDGSGASIQVAAEALKYYFKYKSGLEFVDEANYSDADWKFLLKEDLDKQHPILYRGTDDTGGGHAFVCDAYQDTSYFHFNWGWSGSGDGFFNLDDQSFHWGQGAVINIMPYWGEYCNSMVYEQESWNFHDGSGANYYWNDSDCEWLIMPEGVDHIKLDFTSFETMESDKLYVYDGNSVDAPLLGEYSGYDIPATITSSGNEMLLRFVTDGEGQARGWYAQYEGVVLGVDDLESKGFSMYPNPTDDVLTVRMAENGNATIQLFDYTGRLIQNIDSENVEERIDVSYLPSGFYVLKIQQGDIVAQEQFIIK